MGAEVVRALDSLSSNCWARFVMKWQMLGMDLGSDDDQTGHLVRHMRRRLEMSVPVFWCLFALLFSVVAITGWAATHALELDANPYWLIGCAGVALGAHAVRQIQRARKVLWRTLMGVESDLLGLGLFVSERRHLNGECDRALTYLEARSVGEQAKIPSLRDLVIFAHRMVYADLEIRPEFHARQ